MDNIGIWVALVIVAAIGLALAFGLLPWHGAVVF